MPWAWVAGNVPARALARFRPGPRPGPDDGPTNFFLHGAHLGFNSMPWPEPWTWPQPGPGPTPALHGAAFPKGHAPDPGPGARAGPGPGPGAHQGLGRAPGAPRPGGPQVYHAILSSEKALSSLGALSALSGSASSSSVKEITASLFVIVDTGQYDQAIP